MVERRPLVLVADDDADILELVRLRLHRSGYDALVARDGEEALALARAHVPDLAVLDVGMPKLDGYAVADELAKDETTREIPVVLLTARVQEIDVARGFAAGAVDYIGKPFSPELLATRVGELLASAAEQRRYAGVPALRRVAQ